jgi:hypothetical protein
LIEAAVENPFEVCVAVAVAVRLTQEVAQRRSGFPLHQYARVYRHRGRSRLLDSPADVRVRPAPHGAETSHLPKGIFFDAKVGRGVVVKASLPADEITESEYP